MPVYRRTLAEDALIQRMRVAPAYAVLGPADAPKAQRIPDDCWFLSAVDGTSGAYHDRVMAEATRRGLDVVYTAGGLALEPEQNDELGCFDSDDVAVIYALRDGFSLVKLPDYPGAPYFRWHVIRPWPSGSRFPSPNPWPPKVQMDPDTEWQGQLLDMRAEYYDVDPETVQFTPELQQAWYDYNYDLRQALGDWLVDKALPRELLDQMYDADAEYNVYMTLAGHGVGIWDGRWKHILDEQQIEQLTEHLRTRLASHVDQYGSGQLDMAMDDAVYEGQLDSNPTRRRGVASGRRFELGGVPYRLPDGLSVQWAPANQAWVVLWNDQLMRVIGDRAQLRDYLIELGAQAVNPGPKERLLAW